MLLPPTAVKFACNYDKNKVSRDKKRLSADNKCGESNHNEYYGSYSCELGKLFLLGFAFVFAEICVRRTACDGAGKTLLRILKKNGDNEEERTREKNRTENDRYGTHF